MPNPVLLSLSLSLSLSPQRRARTHKRLVVVAARGGGFPGAKSDAPTPFFGAFCKRKRNHQRPSAEAGNIALVVTMGSINTICEVKSSLLAINQDNSFRRGAS